MRLRPSLRRFWQFLQQESFDRLLFIIGALLGLSAIAITLLEPGLSLLDGLWWSIVTLTTVGYGDISPTSIGGRFLAAILMLSGIGLLGTLSASIAGFLIEKRQKEDRGMSTYTFTDHIILCEWNHRAHLILNEFRADAQTQTAPIVLIADLDQKPLDDDYLFFVRGNVTDETLRRANLAQARTVVILGDDRLDDTARDAKVVLITLTVESINRAVYTIVELVDEINVPYCERAHADEIIVGSELSSSLIARAALNHGITKIISEVLSTSHGTELYKLPLPASMVGQPFIDVFIDMKRTYQSIILAIQKGAEGEVLSNPPDDYQLAAQDYLIVIAEERPQL